MGGGAIALLSPPVPPPLIRVVLFKDWLEKHFVKHAVASRPLLLLLDGHSSHYVLDTSKFAKEKDNYLLSSSSYHSWIATTGCICVWFFKKHWANACQKHMEKNPTRLVTRYQFSTLLIEAWIETMKPANICAGFRACGVYPFNSSAVQCSDAIYMESSHSSSMPTGGE